MGDFGEESDDSDGEGGTGNVNRLIMRPPGHSGKAKRGHLCFDASFETGNLGRVDLVNEYEYDLFLRPDTCSPRLRFWFNFTVDNVRQDQRVIFNIVNISKRTNLYSANMTPIVKSSARNKWQRIPKKHVFYQRSPMHKHNHVLSFAFTFDKEDEVFQFALAPPYSYSRLQTFLGVLETRARASLAPSEIFSRDQIGESVQKRRLDMISVGFNHRSKKNEKRRVIIIMARIHPAETSSSFVCQGLLELLVSSHPIARELRDTVVFKVVPMVNPDGVFLGNYRSNLMGFDLNRSWHLASPFVHPTIKSLLDAIIDIDKNKEYQLDFVIDIHGHTSNTGCFIYGNSYENVYRYERHIVFPKILASVADDYNSSSSMFNADNHKLGTARRHLCTVLNERVNCYSFEVSLFSYRRGTAGPVFMYDEDTYMRCGRNLLRAVFEFYRANGVLTLQYAQRPLEGRRAGGGAPAAQSHRQRPSKRRNGRGGAQSGGGVSRSAPASTRTLAPLHLKDLSIHCDSSCEGSGDEEEVTRRLFRGRMRMRTGLLQNAASVPVPTYIVLPEPSLSIIDFNALAHALKRPVVTRGDTK